MLDKLFEMGFQIMGTEHLTNGSRLNREQETWAAVGINTLAHAVSRCAHEHGWWEGGERNMGEMIALMHSELSEALEAWRDGDDITTVSYQHPDGLICETNCAGDGKPVGVASEFADVIIRILDTCETLNIPIAKALIEKHNYNLTRPYRHGGKRA